ncbi:MAG: ComEC/Rec2 family competence protein, partial [Bacteroidota bacterium]
MFEKFLHQTPYFRFVLPLIGGIFFQIYFYNIDLPLWIILSILFCIILIIVLTKQTQYFFTNRVWGLFVSVFIFLFGMQLVKNKQKAQPHFEQAENTYIATIIENPTEKKNSFQIVLTVSYLKDSCGLHRKHGKILAYFEKDSIVKNLHFGDQLIIKSYINPIKHNGNPNTFNYKKYLSFQEIYHQAYIKSESFKTIDRDKGFSIMLFSNKIRNKLLNIYRQNEITGDEFAVLSALTLGYKQELNPEIRSAFSSSGAMHILAVSGLHVGIIYIILTRLLFFLQRNKYGKILQSLIIIILLFFYAFLTGLSSSVLRATLMFAILGFGKMFVRQTNIYNTIFVSAFVMLLANPYSITDVGFQLSYLAVFSIIFFYPKIYSLIKVNHFFAD